MLIHDSLAEYHTSASQKVNFSLFVSLDFVRLLLWMLWDTNVVIHRSVKTHKETGETVKYDINHISYLNLNICSSLI